MSSEWSPRSSRPLGVVNPDDLFSSASPAGRIEKQTEFINLCVWPNRSLPEEGASLPQPSSNPLPKMTSKSKVPKPGPAKLTPRAGLDEWLEQAKLCRYLPESAMKQLCEMVKECLMEGRSPFLVVT
jgi:hypothetical protein